MNIKEMFALFYHSFVVESIEVLKDMKEPRTWFYLVIGVLFYALYTGNRRLILWMWPLIISIYIVRQYKDGSYKRWMMKRAILRSDDKTLKEFYERYVKKCFHKSREPLDYDSWKKEKHQ